MLKGEVVANMFERFARVLRPKIDCTGFSEEEMEYICAYFGYKAHEKNVVRSDYSKLLEKFAENSLEGNEEKTRRFMIKLLNSFVEPEWDIEGAMFKTKQEIVENLPKKARRTIDYFLRKA